MSQVSSSTEDEDMGMRVVWTDIGLLLVPLGPEPPYSEPQPSYLEKRTRPPFIFTSQLLPKLVMF